MRDGVWGVHPFRFFTQRKQIGGQRGRRRERPRATSFHRTLLLDRHNVTKTQQTTQICGGWARGGRVEGAAVIHGKAVIISFKQAMAREGRGEGGRVIPAGEQAGGQQMFVTSLSLWCCRCLWSSLPRLKATFNSRSVVTSQPSLLHT